MSAQYNFKNLFEGETFFARQITIEQADETPLPNALASVTMQLRNIDATDPTADLELSTANGGITILNAANWILQINRITSITVPAGAYVYGILFVDVAGNRHTYMQGNFNISLSPSRP